MSANEPDHAADPTEPRSDGEKSNKNVGWGASGLAVGIAIGVAIGTAMDNIALGIAIGVAIGVAMGGAFAASGNERETDQDASDADS